VFTVEELVRQMDASGIAHACLVQRATLYGYDNRYTLDAAARFAGRLAPIIVLDAQEPDSARNLTRLAAAHRLAGLRLVAPTLTADDTAWLDSDPVLDFWAAASELKLPVTVILYRLNNTAGRSALARVARRFRDMPILVDHVGLPHPSTPEKKWGEANGHDYSIPTGPDFGVAEHLAELGALPHVFFKVTDINFDRLEEAHLDAARFVRVLADAFGADRLLWGSDVGQSPAPYAEKVARLHHAAHMLNEVERTALFGGTAMRLYGAALGGR
jgi:predicted TIM-barrel fold metal-dependent hydrolase